MKIKNLLIYFSIIFGLSACYDLNKEPEGVLSSANPFTSTGEMMSYLDQFYHTAVRHQGFGVGGNITHIAARDVHSDNMSSNSVSTRLAGETALSSAASLSQYNSIRNINFFLNNLGDNPEEGSPIYNQYVGEGYYFRAWYYYVMLVDYGPVTWLSEPLEPNIEDMLLERDSRVTIVDSILSDLDKAVYYLSEQDNSASMRIHRDVARALKSEVALFEGTWEKYHKAKNTPFFDPTITDQKIDSYFEIAASAAKEVMDRNVWKIYSTGDIYSDYRYIFKTEDLSNNSEILWFKRYDGDQIGNSVTRFLNRGGGEVGVTASLVDDYLSSDGRPFLGEERLNAKKVYGEELLPSLRDPRLSQTVVTPGQQLRPDDQPPYFVVPPLAPIGNWLNTTGYSVLKHVQTDYTGDYNADGKGSTPAIQFRYADILLNYAEALAELDGAANSQKIIDALQPSRERVGMPAVDFDREYNQDRDYPFYHLDKYIQAVRRERRVEKAIEGRRLEDILRWAAADELIVNKWPKGALFVGSNLENHPLYEELLVYDQPSGNNIFLTGEPGDEIRYIVPSNPAGYPQGWMFNLNRDYLLPIQTRMISLTGGKWEQNPGW